MSETIQYLCGKSRFVGHCLILRVVAYSNHTKNNINTQCYEVYSARKGGDVVTNEDIRLKVFISGISYREIARAMGCRHDYLSRIMRKPLSDKNRKKVLDAIHEVENQGKA